ncbi:Transcriptional activator protein LysR (plasmid) [Neorhizobium galegae bv. officinalis bv. officinalis str. HAMBI 1141]|uniref:Transcriptional activator protein LysR n=1 Tax=Neorhizobium galegae bv. officinalis bv. officinalis str. HAMBI 1141 TaxID=1028801 RepID=A0A068TG71_NEOGA|nr:MULTISPECIES: LysR substrate-binding domain-containing protein [Neorhizobium]MCJ9670909.1 LysR substrate-binding domain-containing protein [Neorhizobium sp. SHOUNA12B]MCJ9745025.1 LysR substrate-binding domain-containing protein [Neorhizobium sp. SHOUNA12A]CDN57086.1 Transcriptional activator protein LysR [Neorhizobium galegae bv. officinalis bv. officinalis str. HAMBI 1141]
MRLKPRQVEAFRSVMMTGGITAAAEAMNVTQPAVSRLIRDLEEIVEIRLFERVGTRLMPTAEATQLFREVERLYLGLDQIAQAADDIRRHKNIVLRIASVTSLVRPYLHQAIIDVVGKRLDIPLVIDVENSRHIWDMVEKNRYDLGFVFSSPRMADKNAVLLHGSHAVAAMAPGHRLASRKVITPADLLDERVLIPGRNSPLRLALDRAFSNEDHQPISTMETSMLNCCYFAASGMGVGIVDHTSLRSASADIIAIPFEPKIEVSYFAIRPSGGQRIAVLDDIVRRMQDMMCAINNTR